MSSRPLTFAQRSIDYIYAARKNVALQIEACRYIVKQMEMYSDQTAENDERDVLDYILGQFMWCLAPDEQRLAGVLSILSRVQELCRKRIERALKAVVSVPIQPDHTMAFYTIKGERSNFTTSCIHYISAADVDIKTHLEATAYIIDVLGKPSATITVHDQRECYEYILRNVRYDKKEQYRVKPVVVRVQALLDKLNDDRALSKSLTKSLTKSLPSLSSVSASLDKIQEPVIPKVGSSGLSTRATLVTIQTLQHKKQVSLAPLVKETKIQRVGVSILDVLTELNGTSSTTSVATSAMTSTITSTGKDSSSSSKH